ncbi:MAG: threonine/serine dehydratase [Calditrichaeota bacterium]|nr:MAG: threonine/serine dehydratase [Calditrichota bacterium]
MHSLALSERLGAEIYLKLENWQKTGSFKVRGAFHRLLLLSPEERRRGVVTASAGNHGLGVAYAARQVHAEACVVVPVAASAAKVAALQQLGVQLVQQGVDYDEAEQVAREMQERDRRVFVHAFSDPEIIAGQGTVGLEVMHDLPAAELILVPVGGGGLISGVAVAAKSLSPGVRVVGVQSEASPAMVRALAVGHNIETPIGPTIADGLAGRFVSPATLELTRRFVDEVVLVSEEAIVEAMRLVLEAEHMLVEGSASVGVAALLEKRVAPGARTVVVLTGRNVDTEVLKKIL